MGTACVAVLLLITAAGAEGPRSGSATLTVDTDPAGAHLFVDGRYAGQTPRELSGLPIGTHRIRLEKPGYLENSRIIDVRNAHSSRVRVTMTPIGEAAEQVISGSGGAGGLASNKWLWVGVAGAVGGVAAVTLTGKTNAAPSIGSVTVDPPSGLQGATDISFSATGVSDPDRDTLTYNWEFGDGATATGVTATHKYATAGTFSATLNVSDGKHTVSARGSVGIVSLTGTWRGNNAPYTVTITHAGSVVTVVWDDVSGGLSRRWTGSGSVTAPRNMSVVLTPALNASSPLSLSATLDSTGNVLTGAVTGFSIPFTLDVRRQ